MAIGITVDLPPLRNKLKQVVAVTGNARPFLELAGAEAIRMVRDKFQQQGPGWRELSERTKMNRRNKSVFRILEDNGTLRRSIVTPASSPGGVYDLKDTSLVIGSNLVYAAIHQFGWPSGGKHPPPTIPARPYLPTPAEMIPRIAAKLQRYLKEQIT